MVQLTNKAVTYNVENQDSNLKLNGTIQITDSNRISTFYGSFYSLQDDFKGGFSYSELESGLLDSSVNSYPPELEDKGICLLDTTIKEIKNIIIS